MRKTALVLATAATLGLSSVTAPSPAEARGGWGWGGALAGGLIAGAVIGGLAIMEGTALLMHRRITAAIDIVGSFARRSPTTAAPGITGGTVTIVTGELLGLR